MKEILELFIYKPKKTEKIVITSLKLLFALCFTIWAYSLIGVKDITDQVVTLEKLKPFILNGHIILFLFVYYLLYQTFFNYSKYAFSLIGKISYWIMRLAYYLTFSLALDFIFSLIAWPFVCFSFYFFESSSLLFSVMIFSQAFLGQTVGLRVARRFVLLSNLLCLLLSPHLLLVTVCD